MKRVLAFLLLCILNSIFFAVDVKAITTEHICRYADSSQNNVVYIFMYDNGEVVSYVKKADGKVEDDNSQYGDHEGVPLDWENLSNQDQCPKFVSFYYNKGFVVGIGSSYEVRVGNSEAELQDKNGVILPLSKYSSLATCTYDVKLSDVDTRQVILGIQPEENFITFSPLPISLGGDNFGPIGGVNYYLDGFYEKIYSNGNLHPQCPELSFCEVASSGIYEISTNSICANTGEAAVMIKGKYENTSDTSESEDLSREVCTRYSTDKTGDQMTIIFSYDVNGNRVFSVYRNNETDQGDTDVPYYGTTSTINGVMYSVDPDYYDVYWKDEHTCDNTPIFFRYYDGASQHYVITAEEPEAFENGSPDGSSGFESNQNTSDPNGNGEFNPNNICKDGNCDPSLTNFCKKENVAKVFRFIGLGFFILKILVPAIIIITGIVNLFKIVTSGKEDDAKKYAKLVVRNVIIGVVIFLAPSIINFVFTTVDDIVTPESESSISNCVNCLLDPTGSCEIP